MIRQTEKKREKGKMTKGHLEKDNSEKANFERNKNKSEQGYSWKRIILVRENQKKKS